MKAKTFLAGTLAALVGFADVATAQPRSDDVRGTVPRGSAADGSRPADGAIKGGSIMPGEIGGAPAAGRGPTTPSAGGSGASRCEQLTGSLRDQCVAGEQGASSGPGTADRERAPRIDPPPQTPR